MPVSSKLLTICQNPSCQKTFNVIPSRLKRGVGKYCSLSCHYQTNVVPRIAVICSNPLCQKTIFIRELVAKKFATHWCSKKCQHSVPAEYRFWTFVEKTETCWLWAGAKSDYGHGIFGETRAHIFSWRLHCGEIPNGLLVCHNCPGGDNPACVNPEHLFLGTQKENMQDAVRKGRVRRGEQHGIAKLTEPEVYEIRALQGILSAEKASTLYEVSRNTIWAIWNRETWTHLPEISTVQ